MPCDPNTLIEQAKCLNACIPPQMLPAVEVSLLCQILDAGGGGGGGGGVESFNARTGAVTLVIGDVSAVADSRYVLKDGDTMTGELTIDIGTQAVGPGTALRLEAVYDDPTVGEDFALLVLAPDDSSGAFNSVNALEVRDSANALKLIIDSLGNEIAGNNLKSKTLEVYTTDPFSATGLVFIANAGGLGFFGTGATAKQVSGANLTNNVTVGGTDDTITNWTSLATYSTDAAAIRNAVYQLSRKLKQINDGLRAYGLFT